MAPRSTGGPRTGAQHLRRDRREAPVPRM